MCPPRLCPRTGTYGRTRENVLFAAPNGCAGRSPRSVRGGAPPSTSTTRCCPTCRGASGPPVAAGRASRRARCPTSRPRRVRRRLPHRSQPAAPPAPGGLRGPRARRLLARLRATGLYRRALVVVTADHGLSFARGIRDRRTATPANLHEVAPVPLFVKLPGSERGAVSRSYASTVDVLPTIARALWHRAAPARGRALGLRRRGGRPHRREHGQARLQRARPARAAEMERRRAAERARRAAVFGTGSWRRLFAIGPRAELIGRRWARFRGTAPGPAEARFAAPRGAGCGGPPRRHASHLGGGPDLVPRRGGQPRAGGGGERRRARGGAQLPAVRRSARVLLAGLPGVGARPGANEVDLYEVRGASPELVPMP